MLQLDALPFPLLWEPTPKDTVAKGLNQDAPEDKVTQPANEHIKDQTSKENLVAPSGSCSESTSKWIKQSSCFNDNQYSPSGSDTPGDEVNGVKQMETN